MQKQSASSKVMLLVNFIVIVMVINAWVNIQDMSPKVTGASISDITGAPIRAITTDDGRTFYFDDEVYDKKREEVDKKYYMPAAEPIPLYLDPGKKTQAKSSLDLKNDGSTTISRRVETSLGEDSSGKYYDEFYRKTGSIDYFASKTKTVKSIAGDVITFTDDSTTKLPTSAAVPAPTGPVVDPVAATAKDRTAVDKMITDAEVGTQIMVGHDGLYQPYERAEKDGKKGWLSPDKQFKTDEEMGGVIHPRDDLTHVAPPGTEMFITSQGYRAVTEGYGGQDTDIKITVGPGGVTTSQTIPPNTPIDRQNPPAGVRIDPQDPNLMYDGFGNAYMLNTKGQVQGDPIAERKGDVKPGSRLIGGIWVKGDERWGKDGKQIEASKVLGRGVEGAAGVDKSAPAGVLGRGTEQSISGLTPTTIQEVKDDKGKIIPLAIPNEVLAIAGKMIDGFPEKREIVLADNRKLTWSEDGKTWTITDAAGKKAGEFRYSPQGRIAWDSGSGKSSIKVGDGKPTIISDSFAKSAKFDKKGNLIIDGITIKAGEATLSGGNTITKKDGSKVIAIDGGLMNVDKGGNNIVIRIGQTEQALTKEQYKQLTGEDIKLDSPEGVKKATSAAGDLKFVIEGLGSAGLSLTDIEDKNRIVSPSVRTYWAGNTQVRISGKGEEKTVQTTTCPDKFNDDGTAKGPYEITTKQLINGEMKVSSTTSASKEDITTSKWELDEKGNIKSLDLRGVKGEWKDGKFIMTEAISKDIKLDYVTDKSSGWNFYKHPDGNLFYNHEYGGWYTYDSKTGYSKAGEDDFKEAGVKREDLEGLGKDIVGSTDKKDKGDGGKTRSARNIQRLFGTLETAAAGGLGRFFSLFMDEDELSEWREGVDEFLCSTIIGGGTECWTSKICSKWVENRPNGGIMYTETPGGMIDIAVHVEAHRETIIYPGDEGEEAREYLYKVTYLVKNPEDTPLGFNVVFEGERTARLYSTNVIIEPNSQSSRLGASAMVQYSNYNYETICIELSEEMLSPNTKKVMGAPRVAAAAESLMNISTAARRAAPGSRMVVKNVAAGAKVKRVCNAVNSKQEMFFKKKSDIIRQDMKYAPGEEARELEI